MSLINSLSSSVSALKAFTEGLDVIGNNISNIDTTAYKASKTSYSDSFSDTLQASSNSSGTAAMQVGTGVQVSGINTDFTQGTTVETGSVSNLAISGNGYFVVDDAASGANYATRDGMFSFNSTGSLVNAQGYQVLDDAGAAVSVANCKNSAGTAITYSNATSVTIDPDGTVTAYDSAGTVYTGQKVGLLGVANQGNLLKRSNNLYDFSATGATLAANLGTPGTGSLGQMESGRLEQSNVDLTTQFADMITTQRSFEAASRLVTISDTILDDIVNMKRS
jgi:flagellar hook protein FlgE